ncbi:MAG: hypothetical protein GX660_20690 [Clostridiaceae bacterium]|nr:hypothetical protein [Clostridiaceae bacterium]
MKSINKDEQLWSNITVEKLEQREEYTSLTPGCCFQLWDCCFKICCLKF